MRFDNDGPLSLLLNVNYSEDDDGQAPIGFIRDLNCAPGVRGESGLGDDQYFCGDLTEQPIFADDDSGFFFGGLERETWFTSLVADYDIGDFTITSSTGYLTQTVGTARDSGFGSPSAFKFFGFPSPYTDFGAGGLTENHSFSQELRIASPTDRRFSWVLGGFYYKAESSEDTLSCGSFSALTFGPPLANPCAFRPDGLVEDVQHTENKAVFALANFAVTDTFGITAELRHAREKKSREFGPGAFFAPAVSKFNSTNPRITLDWQPMENINLYASVARGNKPGGHNDATAQTFAANGIPIGDFEEETQWNYEIGVKTSWLDNRLVANVTGFFSDIKNLALTDSIDTSLCGGFAVLPSPPAPCSPNSAVVSVGDAEIFGIELEIFAEPVEGLTFNGSYVYNDPEITSGNNLTEERYFGAPFVLGDGDISGRQIPRTSKHQVSLAGRYTRALSDSGMDWFLGGDMSYYSDQFVQVHNKAIIPARTVVGMNLGIQSENVSLKFYGKNILDNNKPTGGLRFIDLGSGPINFKDSQRVSAVIH